MSGCSLQAKRTRARVERLPSLQGSRTLAAMNASTSVALLASTELTRKVAGAHNSRASNPSIERTPKSQLRCLLVTAHVER